MIKLVLWDIGNVIIDSAHAVAIARLVEQGVPYFMARRFFANDDYADFARGLLTGEEFAERQCMRLERVFSTGEIRAIHDCHMFGVAPEVVAILHVLKARGTLIAFATATNEWQTRRERELIDLRLYSDTFFRSNEMGALKTDPGAFEAMAAALVIPAADILFIDDSAKNVECAVRAGLTTVQFTTVADLIKALEFHGVL